jgi:hypothetical protein
LPMNLLCKLLLIVHIEALTVKHWVDILILICLHLVVSLFDGTIRQVLKVGVFIFD